MDYKEYRKDKIMRYLDSLKNGYRIFPPSLQVALTDKCFNTCPMCSHWRRKDKQVLSKPAIMDFLEYGESKGLESVCYSGGDPFAYKSESLNSIMYWHVANNVNFGFIASGFVPDIVDLELLALSSWVRCSIDDVGDPEYRQSRGGIGWAKVQTSLANMIKAGVNVCFGVTIHKYNQYHIGKVFELAMNLGIKEVRTWVVRNVPEMRPSNPGYVAYTLCSFRDRFEKCGIEHNLDQALDILYGHSEQLPFDHCYACLYQLFIDASGDIYPCCIIAGDTEESAHHPPLGHILDKWPQMVTQIYKYSTIESEQLPQICGSNCILRLSTINHFAGEQWEDKHFL